ncbi:MAG TPA: sulfotransferase [Ramlibacter sp.]|nr:sulfotransferase [Ramlibacter sp.]
MQDIQKTIQESLALEQAQRYNDALNIIHTARRQNPGARALALRQAQLLEAIKQPQNALQMYKQLAEAQPESQEPMLVLGMARSLLKTSHYQQAAELFTRMKGNLPPNPEVLVGLAACRRHKNALDEASLLVEEALALATGYKPAVHELAEIQVAKKDTETALQTLEKNVLREDLYGDSIDLWLTTLRDLKRDRYTQEKLQEAARKWPQKVEFIFALGVQAHRAGEVSIARPAFEQADKLSPNNHRILHEWGVLERIAGSIEFSQSLLARSLDLNPEQPGTLRTYGQEHKYAYGDTVFTRLNYAAAKLADVEPIEQVHLHYALAKAFEDVSELDTAFRHYETAGVKKRRIEKYDERLGSRLFQVLPQAVNAQTAKLAPQKGCDSEVPVFILGMPRSGTSLMEQILSSHPDVFGAGELKFLPAVVDNIQYGQNRINLNEPEPAFPYDENASWEARGQRYVQKLQELADKPYKRIVDKMPGNFTLVGLIGAILPHAKIIHSRRHPVETCLSNYRIHFAEGQLWSYNLRELGRYYKRYCQLMQFWREQYPGLMYEVRYEDNVADVEGQARKLIDFLGLDWHDACLEFYNTDRPVKTASASQVRKPIYTTSTNRWRKYEKHLGPLLDELGDIVPEYEAEIAHLSAKG